MDGCRSPSVLGRVRFLPQPPSLYGINSHRSRLSLLVKRPTAPRLARLGGQSSTSIGVRACCACKENPHPLLMTATKGCATQHTLARHHPAGKYAGGILCPLCWHKERTRQPMRHPPAAPWPSEPVSPGGQMEKGQKRSVLNFTIWIFASTDLYFLSYFGHLTAARIAASVAVFLSMLTFVLSYRSGGTEKKLKMQITVSASATILAGFLYLAQSGWRP